MDKMRYLKAYARVVWGVDEALTIMDTGNLLEFEHIRQILQNALLDAEEIFIEEMMSEEPEERS